jgi:hypothetical protein
VISGTQYRVKSSRISFDATKQYPSLTGKFTPTSFLFHQERIRMIYAVNTDFWFGIQDLEITNLEIRPLKR